MQQTQETRDIREILKNRIDEKFAKLKWRCDNDRECYKKHLMAKPFLFSLDYDEDLLSKDELDELKKLQPEGEHKERVFADLEVLEKEVDDFLSNFEWSTDLFKQSFKKEFILRFKGRYEVNAGDCPGKPRITSKYLDERFRDDIQLLLEFDRDFAASGKDWDSFLNGYLNSFYGSKFSFLGQWRKPSHLLDVLWGYRVLEQRRCVADYANEKFCLDTMRIFDQSEVRIKLVNNEGIEYEMPKLDSIVGWSLKIVKYDEKRDDDGNGVWQAVLEPPPPPKV